MAGLEACQADSSLSQALESLAQSLAQAQGKLFPASKLPADSPAAVDMMRRGMEYLAQALKVLQEVQEGGDAVTTAAASIAQALKTLHPVVQAAKEEVAKRSVPPPARESTDALSVNVNTMLNLNTDHQFYNGFSENIEEGGIFVATFDPKPMDAKVIVNFKLPGGRPVTARGRVHFVREFNPLTPDMAPGMGVKFTDLMPGDKDAIEEYVKERAPMFYDE
ncbi:MAG: hypothetical protein GY847_08875 [Proteobacteria bacterium]|nr:hypothetical protein [Pseudomonadota bacterium]